MDRPEDDAFPSSILSHLTAVLERDGPMTFQMMLLDVAHSQIGLSTAAEILGVQRETLWSYNTGLSEAPFGMLVKIVALIGAKLVMVPANPAL